jgi:hypothetical protein
LCRLYLAALHDPVVHIVVEVAVSHLEVQLFEEGSVFHDVETVVHIEPLFLGEDQGVPNEFAVVDGSGEVVKGIARLIQQQST